MFQPFSEASRLFAQNYSVIEAVKGEFQREVDSFLSSVHQEIQSTTGDNSREKITPGYRYWWIGGQDRDKHPQLWVSSSAPEIVHPGKIEFTAVAPSASADQLRALGAVARNPEFSPLCRAGKGGPWSLFTASVSYEDEHPVQRVSRIAAKLLLALNDAYERASGPAAEPAGEQKAAGADRA